MTRVYIPGDAYSYYARERKKYNEAFASAQPSAAERELMLAQVEAVKQAQADRQATIPIILGQLGFKIGTGANGKKTLVPLTNQERTALMSQTDRYRAEAAQAYQGRAQAAAKGETKLPSFLKKDIDYQKVKENALLEDLLGPEVMKTTAGQQAVEALRKKEENIRQRLQDQDLAMAPGAAMGLSEQLAATRGQKIRGLEALPGQQAGLIQGRGSLLQQMQQRRLDDLKKRLGELENKRQMITNYFTLGGTVGGAAAAYANQRKTQPDVGTGYTPIITYRPDGSYSVDGKGYYDYTY